MSKPRLNPVLPFNSKGSNVMSHSSQLSPPLHRTEYLPRAIALESNILSMRRRTETAYKAEFPGKSATHDKALGSRDTVNAAVA